MARRKDRCVGPLFFVYGNEVEEAGWGEASFIGGECFRAR